MPRRIRRGIVRFAWQRTRYPGPNQCAAAAFAATALGTIVIHGLTPMATYCRSFAAQARDAEGAPKPRTRLPN